MEPLTRANNAMTETHVRATDVMKIAKSKSHRSAVTGNWNPANNVMMET
jgi:hypothetical protein